MRETVLRERVLRQPSGIMMRLGELVFKLQKFTVVTCFNKEIIVIIEITQNIARCKYLIFSHRR